MLNESIKLGGLTLEKDFYGNKGGYGAKQFKIAYKPGKSCPAAKQFYRKSGRAQIAVLSAQPVNL